MLSAKFPAKPEQNIVISAHIDHFGRNEQLDGDQIFNGAIDNGSAVAAMALVAKILRRSRNHSILRPHLPGLPGRRGRTAGLQIFRGQCRARNIAANINFESTPVWEQSPDVFAVGARYSTLEDLVRKDRRCSRLGIQRVFPERPGVSFTVPINFPSLMPIFRPSGCQPVKTRLREKQTRRIFQRRQLPHGQG